MLKKLFKKIALLADIKPAFNAYSLNDPVALEVDWSPARGGGASFKTHSLVAASTLRMEFRSSLGAKLFYLVFLLAGLGTAIGVPYSNWDQGEQLFTQDITLPLLIGSVFAIVGGCLLYLGTAPIVFDKRKGMYWKGRKVPARNLSKDSKNSTNLNEIHALQLIAEYCSGDKTSYYSYELNLVLKNGERLNVLDHGNKYKLLEDANTLATFLGKPVWNAM